MNISVEPSFHRVFNQSAACLLMQVNQPQFTIVAVSDKYLDLTSTRREDLLGRNPFDIFPDKLDNPDGAVSTRKAILQAWETGKTVIIPDYLYWIYSPSHKKLEPRWWRSTFEAILDEGGNIEYVLGTAIDQTYQHQVHSDLDKAEQMLHLAIEAGDIGTWSINVKTGDIVSSSRSKALFGLSENEHSTLQGIIDAVHPDFKKKVEQAIEEAMDSDGSRSYIIDYPLTGIADQQERWVRSTARIFSDHIGNEKVLCGTLVDITESKILERKKSDFVTMVSHEMKTPLTAITAYLDLIIAKASGLNDSFIKDSISKARVQTLKLRKMIVSFLDLAGIEDGKLNLIKSTFSFSELAEEIINDMLPFAFDHQIYYNPAQEISLTADREKIGQVLSNLLSNAIKYSGRGTKIELYYTVDNKDIKVMVTDQGIGIPLHHQKKLFERFYRVDHSQKVKAGFGIGLYLAAEIIRNHDGNIGVASDEGIGSTFWFTLPINYK